MSLKYFILVLLLMSLFHTSILSEKTRFGYPFEVPCLVFFLRGRFATRPGMNPFPGLGAGNGFIPRAGLCAKRRVPLAREAGLSGVALYGKKGYNGVSIMQRCA